MDGRSWVIPLKMPDSQPNGNRPNAVLRFTNHAILPTFNQAPPTLICLLRPPLSSRLRSECNFARVRHFAAGGFARLTLWASGTSLVHHVVISREHLFDARGISLLASFVLTRTLSCSGFQ